MLYVSLGYFNFDFGVSMFHFAEFESDRLALRLVFETFAELTDALDFYRPRYPDADVAYGTIHATNASDAMESLANGDWTTRIVLANLTMVA